MRILIADDEPMVRLGIRTMIEDKMPSQHAMAEAANGKEVVLRAADHPDLAFVDIRMPLMDGIQAITEAKNISPDTQWVLVTGFSDFVYAQQAIRLGVTDYLLKPVSPEELSEVVRAAECRLPACAQLHRQTAGPGDIIAKIKAYVAAHYMRDIAISTLAGELDITPNYLSRIFHQRAGCTFVSYVSQVRIGIAQQLLSANPNISIREVSEAVGYLNPRHFTKVFAKLTGKTPSVYQIEKAFRTET